MNDKKNIPLADPKACRDRALWNLLGAQAANFHDLLLGKLCVVVFGAWASKAGRDGMGHIFGVSYPLQVFGSIIKLVAIPMIYRWALLVGSMKSERHKPVNSIIYDVPIFLKNQLKVSVSILAGDSDPPIECSPDAAMRGCLVATAKNRNQSPFFMFKVIVNRHAGNLQLRFCVWLDRVGMHAGAISYYAQMNAFPYVQRWA